MPHPMDWFRWNDSRIAWLAFFALACQFVLTFGHVHPGNARSVSTVLAIPADSANGSSSTQSLPPQRTPVGLAQDFCAVCNNISLANTLVLPVAPAANPSASIIQLSRWSLIAIEYASCDHFCFNARGPPQPEPAT